MNQKLTMIRLFLHFSLSIVSLIFLFDECKMIAAKNIIKINKNKDYEKMITRNREQKYYSSMEGFYRYGFESLKSEESILRAHLLANYSADVRPVVNVSTVTFVNITLTILQIMDLDEQNQVMITNAQIALRWHDQHLIWNPDEFYNQSRIVLSSKDIWVPDIVLFNSADVAYSTQRDNYLITVNSDGYVMWMFPDILRSYCRVDIKYFPFDKQNCTLELQSWSRTKKEVIVYYDNEKPFMNHSFINTEWKLLNIHVTALEQNEFVWLEFVLHLKRNHAFYVNHMIFPFAILSSLTLFVFWLPPDSGEKITLTITILLALTVFLQLITEYTPKAAKSLPIIGLYFNVNLILVLISVILTIIVLNFHFRGPKKQRVPKWMRKYIIGYLGRVFCFCHESNLFYPIGNKSRNEEADVNYDIIQISSKNANSANNNKLNVKKGLNLKENRIVLEYDTTAATSQNEEANSKLLDDFDSGTKVVKKSGENSNKPLHNSIDNSCSPFNDRISRNLEKMLIKLQKSFDPFKLHDETLKFEILKEILECQRLLLQSNLTNKKQKQITINEIYDEWKILAMIVDRICFFIYLFALIGSSILFFLKENVEND